MEAMLIADYACTCGEGPLWHPTEKRLYWTDIDTGRMFWYDPKAARHQQCYQGSKVGGFTVQANGALLLFRDKGNIVEWRDGQVTKTIVESIPDQAHGRFNDVYADPAGRVFCGTLLPDGNGKLYRLDPDASLTVILEKQGCPNGITFSLDHKLMYYTESRKSRVTVFDYDPRTGQAANPQTLFELNPALGTPDGLTIDENGDLWSARWDGYCVARHAPDGAELGRVSIPARQITSMTFGGQDLEDMFVTCAGGHDKAANGPAAGALFHVRPGVKGVPDFPSRIGM